VLVNLENNHKIVSCPTGPDFENGDWHFISENRVVKAGEMFEWVLNPYEVKLVRFEKNKLSFSTVVNKEWEGNLIRDFSFEKWSSVGIPTACYLHMSKEHGATAFLDRSVSHHGELGLRLNNLGGDFAQDNSQEISLYQFQTVANHAYIFSFWAYAEQSNNKPGIENQVAVRIEKPWGKFIWYDTIDVKSGWNRYDVSYIPSEGEDRNMLELRLLHEGFVWFDQIQWVESPSVFLSGDIFDDHRLLSAQTIGDLCPLDKITYLFTPVAADTIFKGNLSNSFKLENQGEVEVQYLLPNGQFQKMKWPVLLQNQRWKKIEYIIEPSLKYLAGGKSALIDGQLGEFVWDGKWQGFEGSDAEVILEVDSNLFQSTITLRCLSKKSAWVYWPTEVDLWGSSDGIDFQQLNHLTISPQAYTDEDGVKEILFDVSQGNTTNGLKLRYFKLVAKSSKKLPQDHPFVGEKSWLFIDEILLR
jgi:hypothetical protein